jgi:hypothetical protein
VVEECRHHLDARDPACADGIAERNRIHQDDVRGHVDPGVGISLMLPVLSGNSFLRIRDPFPLMNREISAEFLTAEFPDKQGNIRENLFSDSRFEFR